VDAVHDVTNDEEFRLGRKSFSTIDYPARPVCAGRNQRSWQSIITLASREDADFLYYGWAQHGDAATKNLMDRGSG
jgi:hypothetical protein